MKKFLESLVLDGTSLVSIGPTGLSKNSTTVVLANETVDKKSGKLHNTYLGDVFSELPHGIINKTETGIGATTLELDALRNSIIVEPLKITASSKAYKKSLEGEKCLYVGSKTPFHGSKTTDKEIEKYVTNTSIKYKKIIVVADSLWRVIQLLESKGIDVYKEYFLLIDEVDSFQMDSSYRASLEKCIDYYMLFDEKMRAMTTATLLSFSNPHLKKLEKTTVFKYEFPERKEIQLVRTDNIEGCCYDIIKRLRETNEKIVVAYNSVSDAFNIAEHLVSQCVFKREEIAILTGANADNKRRLKGYFHELSSETFPRQLNFKTSAYFTGYDIKEPYHLLSVSEGLKDYKRLSINNVIQIMGRNRLKGGLLSNILLYRLSIGEKRTMGEEGFISQAKTELDIVKCTESNYEANLLMKTRLLEFRKQLQLGRNSATFQYVRRDLKDQNVYSFLNIDSAIENERVFNVYRRVDQVKNAFEVANFGCTLHECHSLESIDVVIASEVSRKESVENFKNIVIDNGYIINHTSYNIEELNEFEVDLIKTFQDYQNIVEPRNLMGIMAKNGDTVNKYNKLKRALSFHKLDKKDLFPTFLMQEFKVGDKYFGEEICEKAKQVMMKSSNHDCFKERNQRQINTFMGAYIEHSSASKDDISTGEKSKTCRKIIGYNPLKLDLLKSGL